MHITIFVYGTWGDIRPHVVLGQGLQQNGHEVQVVAAPVYEEWVRERGLGFHALSVDMNTFMKENASIMDENIIGQIRNASKVVTPIMVTMALETYEATRNSDVLITVEFGVALLFDVIKANNLKTILINPAPLNPTVEFSSALPPAPGWFPFPEWYNRTSYSIFHRLGWTILGSARKKTAKELPGQPKSSYKEYKSMILNTPALTTVSKHIVQGPADWAEHFQVTGYLIDDDANWTAPQELVDFLDAGEPPVYIGFGSMPDSKAEKTTQILIDAIQKSGKRAIILKGWAGFAADTVPETIFILDYAPHSWLFPKMAALIHHGGAGTTASGFRSGVPQMIVPHNADQPYWGRMVEKSGVGTKAIPRLKITADNLADAIKTMTSDSNMSQNAQAIAEKISQEDGLSETVKWVERFLK